MISDFNDPEFLNAIDSIPEDINNFKNDLKELIECAKADLSDKEIHSLFFSKARLLPTSVATLQADTINMLTAFRNRINVLDNEDTSLINTFSYPNYLFCTSNQRANLKYKPVFYCSDRPDTALMETKLTPKQIGYLSVWKINCDRDCNYSAFFPLEMPLKNAWYNTATIQNAKMIKHVASIGSNKSAQLQKLFHFIASLYVTEKFPYTLTSWLSNHLLYDYRFGIDFIVYPSFQTHSLHCNIAFHPNFIEQYFKLHRVFKLRLINSNGDEGKFQITMIGKINFTGIEWTNNLNHEEISEYFPGSKPSLGT